MKPVLLFDLNETLIDFSKLDTWFDRWLGAGAPAAAILTRRPGLPLNPALVTPTLTVDDLSGVADYLLSSY